MAVKIKEWRAIIVISFISIIIFLPADFVNAMKIISKVAIVNGKVITKDDFYRTYYQVLQQVTTQGVKYNEKQLKEIKEKVLDTIIDQELLYQESLKEGIKVENELMEIEYEKLKNEIGKNKDLHEWMKKMEYNIESFKHQINRDLSIKKIIQKKITDRVSISEKEVAAFYKSHKESFIRPARVRISRVLINAGPKSNIIQKTNARKKIENIRQRILKGENFAEIAKKYSDGSAGTKGGDLGFFNKGQLIKIFDDIAFELKIDEISDIVKTDSGYHIIKITGKQNKSIVPLQEVKKKIIELIKDIKVRKEIINYSNRLKKKARVKIFMSEIL
ncbi:MAG: hypothetical protein HN737_03015 [Desulfobacterales bacterium]|jgi:peptidyl-prolyl cis-trans isomerase C|nr:hypothetical protein [Desulfobacteraceae bacterium]MBT4363265.1 hypothetical protein [Desulfobacteraceae bacterium]MBT7085244.1 hypothetical protein [Desulfobacterales bacterium]MBT7696361.1 hypothetical protein [Desulfobacterales bacterium]